MNTSMFLQPSRATESFDLSAAMRRLDQRGEKEVAQSALTDAVDRQRRIDLDSPFNQLRLMARPGAEAGVVIADKNRLTAVDPATSEPVWTHQTTPDFYHARFAVSLEGNLVAALDQNPMRIQILDAPSGSPEASLNVPGKSWFTNRTALEFSPAGRLLATFENGTGTTLMAFQPGSEEPAWTAELGSGADAYGVKIASAPDDSLHTVSFGNRLAAVSGENGQVLWTKEVPAREGGQAGALVADGRVYSVEKGRLVARAGQTGDVVWTGEAPSDPALAGSPHPAIRQANELRNLAPVSGPDGLIYTLQGQGNLTAFKPDGEVAWQAPLPAGAQWPPTLSKNSLFAVSTRSEPWNHHSTIHVLDARKGLRWADSEPLPGRVRLGLTTTSDGQTHLGLSQGLLSVSELETALQDRFQEDPGAQPASVQVRDGAVMVGGIRLGLRKQRP